MRNLFLFVVAFVVWTSMGGAETASLDFTVTAGKIRRELHSSGWGGQLVGRNSSRYMQIKPLNLKAARTHDWALSNPGQRLACRVGGIRVLL